MTSSSIASNTPNAPGSPALFGTSDWRADRWEDMARTVRSGDTFQGLRGDGTWWRVTARVVEGILEGRHQCRFVYVGWRENGRYCESSWECFATLCRHIQPFRDYPDHSHLSDLTHEQ